MSRLSEDLRGRTKRVASDIIALYVALPKHRREVDVLGLQLLRSGTSIAAHAREASRARSDAEFCSKLDGLLQEADESWLWLELLKEDCNLVDAKLENLLSGISEILAVFTSIVSKVRRGL
jgi:four helix bundle protein